MYPGFAPAPMPAPVPAPAGSTGLVPAQPVQATAAELSNVEPAVQATTECNVCFESLVQLWVLPNCRHARTCLTCIDTIIRENPRVERRCPECRTLMTRSNPHWRVIL
mmetsp:Transcript_82226/g.199538  ORF Transcript_82226/g.199538 Transcript_82226/m.199538 type:complete len:108 (+) Transcript_82226:1-324(+)